MNNLNHCISKNNISSLEIEFEHYSYNKKISKKKCYEMLDILIKFYNEFNGKDNGTKEMCDPWINMIRNTKDYYVLLCYENNLLIGFVNYMYQNDGLMLSEVQIREEYQNKGLLKVLLREVITKNRCDNILCTIHKNNIKSQNVFTHVGFKLVKDTLYKISYDDLIKWINNKIRNIKHF